jgi:hypothetical protein
MMMSSLFFILSWLFLTFAFYAAPLSRLIYRDIKPTNIGFDHRGKLHLSKSVWILDVD